MNKTAQRIFQGRKPNGQFASYKQSAFSWAVVAVMFCILIAVLYTR